MNTVNIPSVQYDILRTVCPVFSNAYGMLPELDSSFLNGRLYVLNKNADSVVYATNGSLRRIFFISKNTLSLAKNLDEIETEEAFVFDYISREAVESIPSKQFRHYATLRRMISTANANLAVDHANRVRNITKAELPIVGTWFHEFFDVHVDRIPTNSKLNEFFENNSINCICNDLGFLSGFYVSSTRGASKHLNYLFVHPEARGKGLSKMLLSHFLSSDLVVKRFDLWVVDANISAIGLYERFNFTFDKQRNFIYSNRYDRNNLQNT